MKDLWYMARAMCRQRALLLTAILSTVAKCALALVLPLLMARAVDAAIVRQDLDGVAAVGWLMLAACLGMGVCGYTSSMACAVMGQRFAREVREKAYASIYELTVQQVRGFGYGSLITRLTVDIDVCAELTRSIVLLLVEPATLAIGGIAMMWTIAPTVGLALAGFVVIQLLIMVVFIQKTAPGFIRVRKATDTLNSSLQSAFGNFRLIKVSNTQKRESARIERQNAILFDAAYAVQRKIALFNPVIMLIMNFAVASMLLQAGDLVATGSLSVGLVLSSINYSEQVLLSIAAVGHMYRVVTEAQPSAARVREVLETKSGMMDGSMPLDGEDFKSLSFEGANFSYPAGSKVFEGLDFSVHAGESVAVVGPIGCGKSTLANLCNRFYDVTGGRIAVNGKDIRSLRMADVRRVIAIVEKHTAIMEDSIRDNIVFGREYISEEDVHCAVETAQLMELIDKKSKGLDTLLLSSGKSLSGGERQRLTIARALAGKPSLLVLDDSTSSLDYVTEASLLDCVRDNYPSMAVLLITNRLVSALRADRIVVLDEGRIVAEGTDAKLRESCPLYRHMRAMQDGEM